MSFCTGIQCEQYFIFCKFAAKKFNHMSCIKVPRGFWTFGVSSVVGSSAFRLFMPFRSICFSMIFAFSAYESAISFYRNKSDRCRKKLIFVLQRIQFYQLCCFNGFPILAIPLLKKCSTNLLKCVVNITNRVLLYELQKCPFSVHKQMLLN